MSMSWMALVMAVLSMALAVLAMGRASAAEEHGEVGKRQAVSQYGITWTFDRPVKMPYAIILAFPPELLKIPRLCPALQELNSILYDLPEQETL